MSAREEIEIFATAPSCAGADPDSYLARIESVSRWAERAGCTGILIYTDNSVLDPWLVAQVAIVSTQTLCPLVAVQPIYMHPYSVAKMVTSLAFLHRRKVYLNMVAGGFKNDLAALGENTPHDKRYDRLVEYTAIIKSLLGLTAPVIYNGDFYRVDRLILKPPLPIELFPGIFVSGSSDAGMKAARARSAPSQFNIQDLPPIASRDP